MDNKAKAPLSAQLFVLVPSHNRRDILCETLAKVRAQLPPEVARLVVVDAGSSDGTYEAVQMRCPTAEIVKGSSEMWWAATVNHGLDYIASTARMGDRVILMNDDIDLAPKALSNLLEASQLEPQSLIGAVNLIHRPGKEPLVYFCGGHYDLWSARHKANIRQGTRWECPKQRFLDTDFLYGRLLIIPWGAFENSYRFDAITFPQYCADEDFVFGAKQRGFKVLMDCKSLVHVNVETTARFSLNIFKSGWSSIKTALTEFNSYYNWKQGWAFARRYARWPIMFMFCRYGIMLFRENVRWPHKRSSTTLC